MCTRAYTVFSDHVPVTIPDIVANRKSASWNAIHPDLKTALVEMRTIKKVMLPAIYFLSFKTNDNHLPKL